MRMRPTGTRLFRIAAGALLLAALMPAAASAAAAAPRALITVPPRTGALPAGALDDGAICYFGACYDYVAASQYVLASGASVVMYQARPELDVHDVNAHSLQELAVESFDGRQIVEVGWTVDRGLNGDLSPHLFVFHWVNGQPTCYNACGFVSTSTSIKPAQQIRARSFGEYAIVNRGGNWWILYDGQRIGYYPGSLWQGRFTRFGIVQAFGEVASTAAPSCSDMGNGRRGSTVGSSLMLRFHLTAGISPARLSVRTVTSSSQYDAGYVTSSSYHLGGRGAGGCA